MNVLEGALRNPVNLDERMGDVDLPRDGMILSRVPESWGVVWTMAVEAGRAMAKFWEDFLFGIFKVIDD